MYDSNKNAHMRGLVCSPSRQRHNHHRIAHKEWIGTETDKIKQIHSALVTCSLRVYQQRDEKRWHVSNRDKMMRKSEKLISFDFLFWFRLHVHSQSSNIFHAAWPWVRYLFRSAYISFFIQFFSSLVLSQSVTSQITLFCSRSIVCFQSIFKHATVRLRWNNDTSYFMEHRSIWSEYVIPVQSLVLTRTK